jgi:hypothetical protein
MEGGPVASFPSCAFSLNIMADFSEPRLTHQTANKECREGNPNHPIAVKFR